MAFHTLHRIPPLTDTQKTLSLCRTVSVMLHGFITSVLNSSDLLLLRGRGCHRACTLHSGSTQTCMRWGFSFSQAVLKRDLHLKHCVTTLTWTCPSVNSIWFCSSSGTHSVYRVLVCTIQPQPAAQLWVLMSPWRWTPLCLWTTRWRGHICQTREHCPLGSGHTDRTSNNQQGQTLPAASALTVCSAPQNWTWNIPSTLEVTTEQLVCWCVPDNDFPCQQGAVICHIHSYENNRIGQFINESSMIF